MKVKLFDFEHEKDLEDAVNEFLLEKDIDVKNPQITKDHLYFISPIFYGMKASDSIERAKMLKERGTTSHHVFKQTPLGKGNDYFPTDDDGTPQYEHILQAKISIDENASPTTVTLSVLDAGPMIIQIGANEGQTVELNIAEVSSETLGLTYLNVLTQDGANEAITMLDEAINMVSSVRSKLGAYQNRLEHAVANLDTSAQNLTEALSRIEDVDMAEEMANYTQKNVLSQAGVSMVSQANERPQNILSLLQ